MPESRNHVVGYYYPEDTRLPVTMWKINRKGALNFAKSINREVAEGPSLLVQQEPWGMLEVWPLVQEVNNDLSG